ncbi:MAG: ABC transporter substrate-binding protein [Pigmentiphaga sp.]|uniref:ABC transporter substrate-binding protein n=1 Tax=Pigmentiphaga sp. TaxID=1977564 RepID=UPI0029BEE62F|nr:ABC transporter substrate-binding protein [Pigmentiphaga sp.]MDX3906121.1 ABC transporter substrate-binding protein [Pigmentiphaga sp.]
MLATRLKTALVLGATLAALLPGLSAAESLKVRYSWKLKGEYAQFYMAKEIGAYAKRGLEVSLGEGAGAQAALGAVLQGQEDAAVVPAAFALTAISKGMPVKIVALYHPRAPIGILSHASNPVATPKDLEGKKIAVSVGDTVASYLGVVCKMNQVDCDEIDRVMMDSQVRSSQFLANRVDALTTYLNVDSPLLASVSKEPLVTLDFSKFGLVLPGMSVVVKDDAVTKKAKPLSDFLAALDEGVTAARKDPGAAAEAIRKAWSGSPKPEVVKAQVVATLEAIPQRGDRPAGYIDPKDLSTAIDMLKSVGELQGDKPVDAFYSNALFTE